MRAILVESWDEPGASEGTLALGISLYEKMRAYSSLPLHLYVRRQFERAVLMAATGQDVVVLVSALEALYPRPHDDEDLAEAGTDEAALLEFDHWLHMPDLCADSGRLTVQAACCNVDDVHPAIVDLFERVERRQASLESPHSTSTLVRGALIASGDSEAKQGVRQILQLLLDSNMPADKLPKGILLHGPPGTGKTMLVSSLISELNNSQSSSSSFSSPPFGLHFESLTVPDILHAEIGSSERSLHEAFSRAILHAPSVIFIDELEAAFRSSSSRSTARALKAVSMESRLSRQLCLEFDRLTSARVVVIAATNLLDLIDASLRGFGRFAIHFKIDMPNGLERASILSCLLQLPSTDERIVRIAAHTMSKSSAALASLVEESRRLVLARSLNGENKFQDRCHAEEYADTLLQILGC